MKRRQEYGVSYLPLAHIYMRMLQLAMINFGGCLGYFQGNQSLLLSDIRELRPTYLFLVPRVVQKIVEGVTSKVEQQSKLK